MPEGDGSKSFASAFKQFVDAMNAEAAKETNPLIERLRAHLGSDPGRMPIVTEDFDNYEHPNVQVALDKVLYSNGRTADLVGISAPNKRWQQFAYRNPRPGIVGTHRGRSVD